MRQRKASKKTLPELDFLFEHVVPSQTSVQSQTPRTSDASQASSTSQSFEEDIIMLAVNDNPGQESIESPPAVDYEMLQKKELWLKRTKNLKDKEEEMQLL